MITNFFKRIGKSKILPWLGMTPFLIFPAVSLKNGEVWQALAGIAFFGSAFASIAIGPVLGRVLNKHVLKRSSELEERLSAGLVAFSFLFIPALVGSWSNAHLDTSIEMYSLGLHFVWACVGGIVFFSIKAPKPKE
jgi:hypothetical protein